MFLNIQIIISDSPITPDPVNDYVPIEVAPTFSEFATVTYNAGLAGQVNVSNTSGKKQVKLSGEFNRAVIQGLIGTEADPIVISNENSSTSLGKLGTGQTTSGSISSNGSSNHVKIIGKSVAEPLVLKENSNGVQWSPLTGAGSFLTLTNIVTKDLAFAGILINNNTSGGSKYGTITISFYRVFRLSNEGEGGYLGNTGTSGGATFELLNITHCLFTDKGRDGIQFAWVKAGTMSNCTFYDVAKENAAQQNTLLQVGNSKITVSKCIFHKAPFGTNIFSHALTVSDCYIHATGDGTFMCYIGDAEGRYGAGVLIGQNEPILFLRCIFNTDANTTYCFKVAEPKANVEWRDCVFSNKFTNLYQDVRTAGFTNSLIGSLTTNGNSVSSSIEVPTYTNFDSEDYDNHGLVNTSSVYYAMGLGYRSPA